MSWIALGSGLGPPPINSDGEPYMVDIVNARRGDKPFKVRLVSPRRTLSSHTTFDEARDWVSVYGAVIRQ